MRSFRRTFALALGAACASFALVPGALPASAATGPGTNTASVIVSLAKANVGNGDCSKNSLGSKGYYTSCAPEFWCADFAKWVWVNAGISDHNSGLTPAALSFYTWAKNNGQFTTTPAVGDVAIFSNTKGDHTSDGGGIHHVAIVVAVSGTSVKLISGDFGGNDPSNETVFSNSSSVVANNGGSYLAGAVGDDPTSMGMYIVGYAIP
jgi:hypothetical protein